MRVAQVPPFEMMETMFCAGPVAASPRGSGAPFGAVGPSGGAALPGPALRCGERIGAGRGPVQPGTQPQPRPLLGAESAAFPEHQSRAGREKSFTVATELACKKSWCSGENRSLFLLCCPLPSTVEV